MTSNSWKIKRIKQVQAADPHRPVSIVTYARNNYTRLHLVNVEGEEGFEILTFKLGITHEHLEIEAKEIESIHYGT